MLDLLYPSRGYVSSSRLVLFVIVVVFSSSFPLSSFCFSSRGVARVFFWIALVGLRVMCFYEDENQTEREDGNKYVDTHGLGVCIGGRMCSIFCTPVVFGLARWVWFSSLSSSFFSSSSSWSSSRFPSCGAARVLWIALALPGVVYLFEEEKEREREREHGSLHIHTHRLGVFLGGRVFFARSSVSSPWLD